MSFSIIVATDLNGGIGKDNKLLFNIKEDLQRFKNLTINHTVIMGRKTLNSLPFKEGFPNRHNIVLTSNVNNVQTYGVNHSLIFKNDINEIIEEYKDSKEEIFIVGGESIYRQFLPYTNKIYLTKILNIKEADSYFKFNGDEWIIDGFTERNNQDIKYQFIDLIRK